MSDYEQLKAPVIENIELLELLSSDAHALVYKARQKTLDRIVILTLPAPSQSSDEFKACMSRLAAVKHPNIQQISNQGLCDAGTPYALFEFVSGQPLDQFLESRLLNFKSFGQVFLPLLAALDQIHSERLALEALSPANIMVSEEGSSIYAKFVNLEISEYESAAAGADHLHLAQQANIFDISCLMFFSLVHRVSQSNYAQFREELGCSLDSTSRLAKAIDLPAPLLNVILLGLTKDPQRRMLNSAAQVSRKLSAALQDVTGERTPQPKINKDKAVKKANISLLISLCLALALVACVCVKGTLELEKAFQTREKINKIIDEPASKLYQRARKCGANNELKQAVELGNEALKKFRHKDQEYLECLLEVAENTFQLATAAPPTDESGLRTCLQDAKDAVDLSRKRKDLKNYASSCLIYAKAISILKDNKVGAQYLEDAFKDKIDWNPARVDKLLNCLTEQIRFLQPLGRADVARHQYLRWKEFLASCDLDKVSSLRLRGINALILKESGQLKLARDEAESVAKQLLASQDISEIDRPTLWLLVGATLTDQPDKLIPLWEKELKNNSILYKPETGGVARFHQHIARYCLQVGQVQRAIDEFEIANKMARKIDDFKLRRDIIVQLKGIPELSRARKLAIEKELPQLELAIESQTSKTKDQ